MLLLLLLFFSRFRLCSYTKWWDQAVVNSLPHPTPDGLYTFIVLQCDIKCIILVKLNTIMF